MPHHIPSYYAGLAPPRSVRPSLKGKTSAKVTIVGGGLAGLTAAYNLAAAGVPTLILEARLCGWGASGRNGGFVSAGYAQDLFALERKLGLDHARKLYALSRQGVSFVEQRLSDFGLADTIAGQGWLKVIRHDAPEMLQEQQVRMARDYSTDLQYWDREAVEGTLRTDRYFAGLHDPEPFHIDPLVYANALAASAEAQGAKIFEDTPALSLHHRSASGSGRRGWTISGPEGTIDSDHVILAGSAYQSGLYKPLENAVLPVATFVIATEKLGSRLDDAIRFPGCIADTRRAGNYYRIVGAGDDRRLLWGGGISTRRQMPEDTGQMMKSDLLSVYPQLAPFNVEEAWSGLMGYTRTKMPVIGLLAGRPTAGLWSATAFGGHGLNTSAVGGTLVAEAILELNENWRLFEPFLPGMLDRLIGGRNGVGRAITQMEYWRLQALDRWQERS